MKKKDVKKNKKGGGKKRGNEPPLRLIMQNFYRALNPFRYLPSPYITHSSLRMPLHMPGEVIRPPRIIAVRALRTLRLGLGPGRKVWMLGPEMPRECAVIQVRLFADGAAEGASAAAAGTAFVRGSGTCPTLAPTRRMGARGLVAVVGCRLARGRWWKHGSGIWGDEQGRRHRSWWNGGRGDGQRGR